MAIVTSQVAVTTTRVKVIDVDNVSRHVRLHCESGTVYVGNAGVTSSNGLKLDNNDKLTLDLQDGEELWAITATGSTNVSILISKVD
jgi:hypothetical protein